MGEKRHVQVKVDAEVMDWFDANCPFSKQDFVEQCFQMLRLAVMLGGLPRPGVYAAHSAVKAYETLTETEATHGPDDVRPESA